ncbi:hypothetical protein O6H91_19G049800 [Diphasiastrum complanatum]|uniref:Uncharacterized protein n=1 Tax=Diphasiastrum complanatum TaxID=34168 RepID=A0ACC2AV68_DIPCM|nr:hypothetical protein O6H91_19G049800 [Diphasiastrum complanatum]
MRRSELMSKGLRLLLRSQFSHLGCRSADISGWNGGNLQLLVPCRNTQVSSFSSIWGSVGAGSLCMNLPSNSDCSGVVMFPSSFVIYRVYHHKINSDLLGLTIIYMMFWM